MRCPKCQQSKSRVIRTRPDPHSDATDLVRQCKNPGCLAVYTSREALVSVIEDSEDVHIVHELAARIAALPAASRELLFRMVEAR